MFDVWRFGWVKVHLVLAVGWVDENRNKVLSATEHATACFVAQTVREDNTGWPKKVSHYRESSLNRIKIVNQARFFTNFDYKMSTKILYVRIKYSMCDLICVRSYDIGKINVYDKIMMKNKTKRENMEIEETYT